jgi:poly(A) polymerase
VNATLANALQAVARLQKADLYIVGGPVRDGILDRPCHDWDFVCRHARKFAQSLSRRLQATFVVLDDQNRIYRVVLPDKVTLDFAEIQGKSIDEDLSRRDFTINAMARRFPNGSIIDPFGGQKDLKGKKIRAVSEKAFKDDPLRLLRAFRFQAQFNFNFEPKTFRWIAHHAHLLPKVSAERIREELLRLLKQPHSVGTLRLMDRAGLLSEIFPEVEACRRTAVRYYGKGGVLKHSFETVENLEWIIQQGKTPIRRHNQFILPYLNETVGGYPREAWLKWAAFLHDIGKPATAKMIKGRLRFFEHEHVGASLALQVARRLRCSRQESHLLALWVRNHMRSGNLAAASRITDRALSRFFRDLGEEGVGMVLVSLADHYTYLHKSVRGKGKDPVEKMSYQLLSSYYDHRAKILPKRLVDGHDLMRHLRLKPGPVIGKLLSRIQDAQADGKVTTREEALKFAKKKL